MSIDPAAAKEQLIANALADFLDQHAGGGGIGIDEFCHRHPELAPELREELETLLDAGGDLETAGAGPPDGVEGLPKKLSGHRILKAIGSGGMGCVYLAVDEALGRQVAIKTLNRRYAGNSTLQERFMREARALAKLSHPNIVRIYSLGPANEPPHFVMEYLEGVPLVDATRALPFPQKAALMLKVARAVGFLHANHTIHRDLKPGNILVGSDLEPKVLDFGLALQVDDSGRRLTIPGEIMGTPDYFSPEHVRGAALDAPSDVFSLGTVFYEMLAGTLPFHSQDVREQMIEIQERDPVLPRRLNESIPGDLQNICLKALEKNPKERYRSAGEMADDLERYLAGEPVLAYPASYGRMLAGKIEQHLRELEGWKRDHILTEYEYDGFRKNYGRLIEREDAWIMQARRLSLTQVSLYLGAWILIVGAALLALFRYDGFGGTPAVLVAALATAPVAIFGVRWWKQARYRIAVAYLLAFCLLLPVALVIAMGEYGWLTALTQGQEKLELIAKAGFSRHTTNLQLWWSLALSLPAVYWLRHFTKSSVFSLMFSLLLAALSVVTLLRAGMLEWLESDPGKVYFYLIPFAAMFLVVGQVLERMGVASDSRYFYSFGVGFTLIALSGVALFHEPYADWLKETFPWTRGQVEYFFIFNAGIYFLLQVISERFSLPQMRIVARSFRFVIPGHVMTSLLLLGLSASALAGNRFEARVFEVLLPLVACLFIFGSIHRQMKNFFATGLLFLAIGIVRLQHDLFRDRALWPIALLGIGIALMFAAAEYAPLKIGLIRLFRRR
jgi:serine/threonine-protein kinase